MKKASPKRQRKPERVSQYKTQVFQNALARLRANLRAVRTARRWTQEMAAHRCGMLFQTYQPIEAGKINVTMTTLARLAEGFEVDIAELLAARRRRPSQSDVPAVAAEKTLQRPTRRGSKRSD